MEADTCQDDGLCGLHLCYESIEKTAILISSYLLVYQRHSPLHSGEAIVEDFLVVIKDSFVYIVGLHEPGTERKEVITYYAERRITIIALQVLSSGQM